MTEHIYALEVKDKYEKDGEFALKLDTNSKLYVVSEKEGAEEKLRTKLIEVGVIKDSEDLEFRVGDITSFIEAFQKTGSQIVHI